MNQSLTLPMADKFYHDKQTSAFIRSLNVSWEKPEKDHFEQGTGKNMDTGQGDGIRSDSI